MAYINLESIQNNIQFAIYYQMDQLFIKKGKKTRRFQQLTKIFYTKKKFCTKLVFMHVSKWYVYVHEEA